MTIPDRPKSSRVVVSDLTSGEMRVVTRAELVPIDAATAQGTKHPIHLEGVSEEILVRALHQQLCDGLACFGVAGPGWKLENLRPIEWVLDQHGLAVGRRHVM